MTRIPLPPVSRGKDARAHPFPIQIALQTEEFLQGAVFHASFADIAAGEFVGQPGGVSRVEKIMLEHGLDQGLADEAWELLRKYQCVFEGVVFQSVLISLNSHWDWYIRRLSDFIRFARDSCGGPKLSKQEEKRLKRAAHLALYDQLEIVELGARVSLPLEFSERQELHEMSLVRNLGLHNRWEIDASYLERTNRTGFIEGELRIVDEVELRNWHSLLIKLLHTSFLECAKRFHAAPEFEK